MESTNSFWQNALTKLDVAFQPIVNIHTGVTYAVEALLRGYEKLGFLSAFALFDRLCEEGVLYPFDLALREKVIQKFITIEGHEKLKLFINIDNRILKMDDYASGNTIKLLARYGLKHNTVCFEISERHEIVDLKQFEGVISHYANEGYMVAIDDYGTGYSGYKLFYQCSPDIIKIDRFFISEICRDHRKRVIVRNMVQQALLLGVKVVAEGVELASEYEVCRGMGFNWAQGYFIQHPTTDAGMILPRYAHLNAVARSGSGFIKSEIRKRLRWIEPVPVSENVPDLLLRIEAKNDLPFLPVLDEDNVLLGTLDEERFLELAGSDHNNNEGGRRAGALAQCVKRCAAADLHSDIETLIECYSADERCGGIFITKDTRYVGYLGAQSIMAMIYERYRTGSLI